MLANHATKELCSSSRITNTKIFMSEVRDNQVPQQGKSPRDPLSDTRRSAVKSHSGGGGLESVNKPCFTRVGTKQQSLTLYDEEF